MLVYDRSSCKFSLAIENTGNVEITGITSGHMQQPFIYYHSADVLKLPELTFNYGIKFLRDTMNT